MKAVASSHACIASSCILVASSHVCIASSCVLYLCVCVCVCVCMHTFLPLTHCVPSSTTQYTLWDWQSDCH